MYAEITISVVAGILIELFFRAIKYYSDKNIEGLAQKYVPYNNYVTVAQYVASGKKRWFNYLIFRNLPPLIIFIFSTSIYQRYFPGSNILLLLSLTAIVSLAPRDLLQLVKPSVPMQEKIAHIINCSTIFFLVMSLTVIAKSVSLSFFAPSLPGVVDNVWSTLFVAILIVLYMDATNQQTRINNDKEENLIENYIIASYHKISDKYRDVILAESVKNNTSTTLMYSILIYEDMNRPEFVRKIENLLVRLFHIRLTVGIAQTKSKKPLSDVESIINAIKILNGTSKPNKLDYSATTEAIRKYNPSTKYIDSVTQILSVLNKCRLS